MDPADYLDARWHSLVREAVELGVSEEDAPGVVRRVLDANQRRIRRAEDPDPLVHEALRVAVLGPPERPRSRRGIGVVVLVAALVAVGLAIVVTRPDDPDPDRLGSDQVPSLFGYDGDTARAVLEDRGLKVTIEPFRACEVLDRVVATDPAAGVSIARGDPVTVFTALPADVACLTDYTDRETAWRLLDFANDRGPAPEFGDRVFVYAKDGQRVVLDGAAATDRTSWEETGVLDGLRDASGQVRLVSEHPVTYALPAIRIVDATEKVGSCGVPDPSVAGAGAAFALLLRPPDRHGCGVRVDVYREEQTIVAVAYYPAGS